MHACTQIDFKKQLNSKLSNNLLPLNNGFSQRTNSAPFCTLQQCIEADTELGQSVSSHLEKFSAFAAG